MFQQAPSPRSPLSERSHVEYGYIYMNCPEQAIPYGSFVTDIGQRGEKDGKSLSLEVTVVLKLNILKKWINCTIQCVLWYQNST